MLKTLEKNWPYLSILLLTMAAAALAGRAAGRFAGEAAGKAGWGLIGEILAALLAGLLVGLIVGLAVKATWGKLVKAQQSTPVESNT